MDTSIDVAVKLEEIFEEEVILPVDLFKSGNLEDKPEQITDNILQLLSKIGFEVFPTAQAPFNAVTRDEDLVVLTGIIVTYAMPRVYQASVIIQVKEETPDVAVFSQDMMRFDPLFLRTQFQIIQSGPVIEDVVRRLRRFKPPIRRPADGIRRVRP